MTATTGETREPVPTSGAIPEDTLAVRLRLVRIHAGRAAGLDRDLTLVEAADRCGFTYQSWSNWERGATPRREVETLQVIADEFSLDLNWLMYGGPLSRPAATRRDRRGRRALGRTDAVNYRYAASAGRRTIDQRPADNRPKSRSLQSAHPAEVARPSSQRRASIIGWPAPSGSTDPQTDSEPS